MATSTMLEVQQPDKLRRASLISEIYSETHFPAANGQSKTYKKRFSAISGISEDGKKNELIENSVGAS